MSRTNRPLILLVVLVLVVASCGKKSTSLSLGGLSTNGPGIDGNVPVGTKRVYTLLNLNQGQNYTVRAEIATLGSDTTVADGTLNIDIYTSEEAYLTDPSSPFVSAAPSQTFPNIYEVNFTAGVPGDYVAVMSGASISVPNLQFFYGLCLMSADPNAPAATTPLTPFGTLTLPASQTLAINPGYIQVYNGGTLSIGSSATLTVSLKSQVTSTPAYPDLFIYSNSSLTTGSLLYSSTTNSTEFIITDFTQASSPTGTPLPQNPNNNISNGITIPGVPFSQGTTTGSPFIVVKGTSFSIYTLAVGTQ